MIGKILSVVRANHDVATERFDENKAGIKDAHTKIQEMQEQLEEQLEEKLQNQLTETQNAIEEFKQELTDS